MRFMAIDSNRFITREPPVFDTVEAERRHRLERLAGVCREPRVALDRSTAAQFAAALGDAPGGHPGRPRPVQYRPDGGRGGPGGSW